MVKRQSKFIVKRFSQDHYTAVFSPISGFFARVEDPECDEPFWASHGPELIDIAITNFCDRGCAICYRDSNRRGSHMSLDDYCDVLRQAQSMHVFQVALGGGNPNQHPDFPEILRQTRKEFGIVPNYTTNGRGLTDEVLNATRNFCGAVAVSAYPPYEETAHAVSALAKNGLKPNIHFTLTSKSLNTAIQWLDKPPSFLNEAGAIIFLNYKPVGRCSRDGLLLNTNPRFRHFLHHATTLRRPYRIGFDSCSVTGLAKFGQAPKVCLEGCDAARFSLFVSERMEAFPCSYMVESGYKGVSLRDTPLIDIWRSSQLFCEIRSKHSAETCSDCAFADTCLSGCPLFPQLNLCHGAGEE